MLNRLAARTLLCWVVCVSPVIANDDLEILSISSETFEYRQKEGIATYQGHVEAVQGTRRLNGDKLEIYRGDSDMIEKIIVYGHPATHQSLPDPNKPLFHAQANTIIYNNVTQELTLQQAARVEQGGDVYEAPVIEYDTKQKLVRSPEHQGGRTTITLKPRE
jgi:lipopolysaccharide transport protein LptA